MIPTAPGSFFLTRITGTVGRGVSAAQAFTRGGSYWTHTGLYLGDGLIIEAEPGGAKIRQFGAEYRDREVLWSDCVIQRHLAEHPDEVEADVRACVVQQARLLEGTPYSYLDYVAIAAVEWHWLGWEKLRGYVADKGHLICSALNDRAWTLGGVNVLSGRLPGDVTPGDLDRLDQAWIRQQLYSFHGRLAAVEARTTANAWGLR